MASDKRIVGDVPNPNGPIPEHDPGVALGRSAGAWPPCSIHTEMQSLRQRKSIQRFAVHAFIFSDFFSQTFCSPLDLLGIHRHTGQFGQQVATFLEADHGPYGADHAHNRRRERRGVHSQGPVARTEAPLTFPTVVVGTFQFQFSDHAMKTFPSSFYITRPPATGTGQRAALVIGMVAVELLIE